MELPSSSGKKGENLKKTCYRVQNKECNNIVEKDIQKMSALTFLLQWTFRKDGEQFKLIMSEESTSSHWEYNSVSARLSI
jgi:hypothetical protein